MMLVDGGKIVDYTAEEGLLHRQQQHGPLAAQLAGWASL